MSISIILRNSIKNSKGRYSVFVTLVRPLLCRWDNLSHSLLCWLYGGLYVC